MTIRTPILALLTCFICMSPAPGVSSENAIQTIEQLDQQLAAASDNKEKAKLCCYRARNFAQLEQPEKAEQDYLQALAYDFQGWILSEFGYFLYHSGEYEKAYKVAVKLENDFPYLQDTTEKLKQQSREKYQEAYYAENPPTITLDNTVDPYRKTRHDYIKYQPPTLITAKKTAAPKASAPAQKAPVKRSS